MMRRYTTKSVPEIREAFIRAWREFAPDASFAGMSLTEFESRSLPVLEVREQLGVAQVRVKGLVIVRDQADLELRDLLGLLVNAVRGDANHGADSALYRAIGYVPKSEIASGLTRRKNGPDRPGGAAPSASVD